jgi:hypothetical protein
MFFGLLRSAFGLLFGLYELIWVNPNQPAFAEASARQEINNLFLPKKRR